MVGRGWAFLHFFLPLKICVCSNPACSVYLSFFFFFFSVYLSFWVLPFLLKRGWRNRHAKESDKGPSQVQNSHRFSQGSSFVLPSLFFCVHTLFQFSSVAPDCLQPHGLQHARPPCPSPPPEACSNSCPSSRWCHPTISSSVVPFSSYLLSFPASGSFSVSQFFASGSQSIGASASASVLPRNIQDWLPLVWTGLISLQSKGLSRVFSNTTAQKHQFFGAQLYL